MSELPKRVRVLIVGGGIHGVGIMHDFASRGWQDVHLVEKGLIGSGTSSHSTKLIHGGLRYLKNIRDFGLVAEALKERRMLMNLAGDLVKPLELVFPALKNGGMPGWTIRAGLSLYDILAGRYGLHRHAKLSLAEVEQRIPGLSHGNFKSYYSFWDGQTDDLGLVRRVLNSAKMLGATSTERCEATKIEKTEDGWLVQVKDAKGNIHQISALYIINCAGPWAHKILEQSGLRPTHKAINNKGSHILLEDRGLKAGLFLQSPEDDRIMFMLPWAGMTLVGTTEDLYEGDPDDLSVTEREVDYLLSRCNRYLVSPLRKQDIRTTFCGLRWLAVDGSKSLTSTSRSYVVGEHLGHRGLVVTLYGGKLTTYRTLAQSIGDKITKHFGEFRPSRTHEPSCWVPSLAESEPINALDRFGSSYKAEG